MALFRRSSAEVEPWRDGSWRDGPWLLLGAAALSAPIAVLGQGGDAHTAMLAGLACLASPCLAIETMQRLARLAMAMADRR